MLLGLCGAAGSGKNTLADHLCRRHGWIQFGFADPIYAAVASILRVDPAWLRDRENKERPIEWLGRSPRELLQTLGTEWGRDMVRDDIWVQTAMRQVEACHKYLRGSGGVVITDVRFENEVGAIKAAGGHIWRIERRTDCLTKAAAQHSSEAGIPDALVDAVIDNSGLVDGLYRRCDAALQRLRTNIMEG